MPLKPALHVQPRTVEIPILFAGQVTAGRRAKMWAFPIEFELGDADFVRDAVFAYSSAKMDILPGLLEFVVRESANFVIEEFHKLCRLLLKDATSIVLVVVGVMDEVVNVFVMELLITRPT